MSPKTKSFLKGALTGAIGALAIWILVFNLTGAEAPVERHVPSDFPVTDPKFARLLDVILGPSLTDGNHVEVLENGVEIFPAMLEAIRGAEKTINFETYVYWSGNIAERFADALCEKARNGVKVNVLLDWVGSNQMDLGLLDEMEEAGVTVERYQPPELRGSYELNSRTHRKLLIIDGEIGFTGGVGIADLWTGDAQDPEHWRDLHFRVEGPVVAQLQAGFLDNWIEARQEVFIGEDYFPPLAPVGTMRAQNFISSPDEGSQNVQLLFLLAIAGARERLRIGTAYMVPDDVTVRTLRQAAERGVSIQILVPGPYSDHELTRQASRALWGRLLEAGIEIYEYQPTMYHTKMMVVDGYLSSVGSTNFDNRSFRLNDESNLNVLDRGLAARLEAIFEEDLESSRRMTLEQWRSRPWTEKITERVSSWLGSQL